jgi:hypothetical protein
MLKDIRAPCTASRPSTVHPTTAISCNQHNQLQETICL